MNTKLFGLILAAAFTAATLTACTNPTASESGQSTPESQSQAETNTNPLSPGDIQAAEGYAYSTGGTQVKMGENMANLLPALGEPTDVFEAPSCAFDGVDKIFYYSGFQINTFPVQGEDYVLSVTLMDDSVTTAQGVYIGMAAEDAKTLQGQPTTESADVLSYVDGDTELVFLLENGLVADISYYLLSQKDSLLA